MNIYLIGHGYMWCYYDDINKMYSVRPEHVIHIPDYISVRFYCKQTRPFDSDWEPSIIKNAGVITEAPGNIAAKDWEVETVSFRCTEHSLARPGRILDTLEIQRLKEISVSQDETVTIPELVDGDRICIHKKDNSLNHCRLSAIFKALAQRAKAKEQQLVLHWCACRAPIDELPNDFAALTADKKYVKEGKQNASRRLVLPPLWAAVDAKGLAPHINAPVQAAVIEPPSQHESELSHDGEDAPPAPPPPP